MAASLLYGAWKVIHAKFIKPVDNALDSFSMLILQWILGTYNIWDVLRIMFNVLLSAVSYIASLIRHPSVLWTETPAAVEEEAERKEAEAECDGLEENAEESLTEEPSSADQQERDSDEEFPAETHEEAELLLEQSVGANGDSGHGADSIRHRMAAS